MSVKTTETLNIIFEDEFERNVTRKLEFPVAGLSLADVNNATKYLFKATNESGANILKNNSSGGQIVSLKGAEYVETRIETTPLT